jgi:hypothetical protein
MIMFDLLYLVILDGTPETDIIEMALNDLPTIYPLQVAVTLVYTSYRVTFPVEMGDVPPLTIISSAFVSPQNATEVVKGNASNLKLAFELDGATTHFLDFWNDEITDEVLQNEFGELFTIRCPPSLNNQEATPSIIYVQEFETGIVYDEHRCHNTITTGIQSQTS